jgi:hypothetical protein
VVGPSARIIVLAAVDGVGATTMVGSMVTG